MPAAQETVRYWGEAEADRQAAFQADAVKREALGWHAVGWTTEFPFGKPGLDLIVTYERDSADHEASQLASAAAPAPSMPPVQPVQPAGSPPYWQQPWQWQPLVPPRPRSAAGRFLTGRKPDEPAIARYLRRLLVFGSLVAWFVVGLVTESGGRGSGPPLPSQYPGLAVVCFLEAAIALGLAWYLYRWIRLPAALRGIGIVILAIFFFAIIHMGIQYAMGQLPIEYS